MLAGRLREEPDGLEVHVEDLLGWEQRGGTLREPGSAAKTEVGERQQQGSDECREGGEARRSASPAKQHATAQGLNSPKNGRRECDCANECEDVRDVRCVHKRVAQGGDSSGTTEVGHRSLVRLARRGLYVRGRRQCARAQIREWPEVGESVQKRQPGDVSHGRG